MDAAAGISVVLLGLTGLYALFVLFNPRGTWKVTEAWQYRKPDAVEPSETGFGLYRLGALVAIIGILIVFGVMFAGRQPSCEAAYDVVTASDPAAAADERGWTVQSGLIPKNGTQSGSATSPDDFNEGLELFAGDRLIAVYDKGGRWPLYGQSQFWCPVSESAPSLLSRVPTTLPTTPPATPTPR